MLDCLTLMSRIQRVFSLPTPELVLLPADGIDSEGVRVLVAGRDDGPRQGEHTPRLLGPRLLIDKILQQAGLIV